MNTDSPEIYHAPTLLFLLCAMSAMAFVVSAYLWMWRALKNSEELERGFVRSVWFGQLLNFLFVMIFSIGVGVYDFYTAERPLHIWGEIVILIFALIATSVLQEKNKGTGLMLRHTSNMLLFGCACLLGWMLTVGFGFTLAQILRMISVVNHTDFDVLVIFVTGLLWNAPIIWMFFKILKRSETRFLLKGCGFHKFLWPVLLAYMILLVPLMMQEVVNSEKWREMENAKPIRQV